MSLAAAIRDLVGRYYLQGTPVAVELEQLAVRAEALSDAASPVTGENDEPLEAH